MDRDGVKVYKLEKKKNKANIQKFLTEKGLSYGFRGNFSHGTRQVVLSRQEGSILSAWVANHSTRFGSSCPLTELAM